MKRQVCVAVIAGMLVFAPEMLVARGAWQGADEKRAEQELVIAVARTGSYTVCGQPRNEADVRAQLMIAAQRLPQPTLRAYVEGGIDTEAGSKALHALLIDASDSGISRIVVDRPDPYSAPTPPHC
nr:hypothetical protein [Dyella sp. ASV24]